MILLLQYRYSFYVVEPKKISISLVAKWSWSRSQNKGKSRVEPELEPKIISFGSATLIYIIGVLFLCKKKLNKNNTGKSLKIQFLNPETDPSRILFRNTKKNTVFPFIFVFFQFIMKKQLWLLPPAQASALALSNNSCKLTCP